MPSGFFLNHLAHQNGEFLTRTLTGPFFLSIISSSRCSSMEKDKLKLIVRNLKLLVDALESEVYSDTAAYLDKRENLDDPASYYAPISDYDEIFNDDDGYPD